MCSGCLNRTSVGLKLRFWMGAVGSNPPGLNRTSVGLKLVTSRANTISLRRPQSNQRGIETCWISPYSELRHSLNRTSVGLKL